ncbi:uncharacterized protein BDR25DRAFT_302979 [Lindgomyces ingoldianus]|uniref:Uncharacterized protein n=1 Tax=Lindgomyces ingoldianus TaxID=673940 RepID=A0ACB6QYW9_9PLEO|nr:uncharacterized protein BDR25DRAFT_302979 [Lindgomyces ingoldianus]KAF2472239.1 hypothetical protein BDR25DRAFT_302979 [Lindgomyces ingoldianus]
MIVKDFKDAIAEDILTLLNWLDVVVRLCNFLINILAFQTNLEECLQSSTLCNNLGNMSFISFSLTLFCSDILKPLSGVLGFLQLERFITAQTGAELDEFEEIGVVKAREAPVLDKYGMTLYMSSL